mgnify:CR=1 FL=1
MNQSRLGSLIESILNTASGFVLSFAAWRLVVVPLLGLPVDNVQNLQITAFFTVLSVARSYLWRRYFNGRLGKQIVSFHPL